MRGFFTNPSRADDSFIPFSTGITTVYSSNYNHFTSAGNHNINVNVPAGISYIITTVSSYDSSGTGIPYIENQTLIHKELLSHEFAFAVYKIDSTLREKITVYQKDTWGHCLLGAICIF